MTKRWTQRPDGSTWGDWGDDDELSRINLLTPEKVLEGAREVEAGVSFQFYSGADRNDLDEHLP